MVGLVPDAENFSFLDDEERSFNLWLVVFAVCRRELTTVDVWVQLLKLKQRQIQTAYN